MAGEPMQEPPARKDFFISYTGVDCAWTAWIAWQLEEAGYTTISQARDFHASNNFVHKMDKATRLAKRTIAVLAPDYFQSKFTPAEWQAAFRRDPTSEQGLLLPVRVQACNVEGLLGAIGSIDMVDLDEGAACEQLLARVRRERAKPATATAFPIVCASYHLLCWCAACFSWPRTFDHHEAAALERRRSELVNAAYGLTQEKIALLWETAPPRIPLKPPTRA